ncbi:MAG: hypothetical protein PHV02_20805 [Rhodocyclaceae bacterium]|nr:hypothetical protein [Rhodocyclaceae bacterium]
MIDSRLPLPVELPVHITLLVPELIWPEPSDQFTLGKLAAPGFEWLIARAQLDRQPRLPFETSLGQLFGLNDAPFGALRLLGEGHAPAREGHWLCADPVHLRFHQERIILADAGAFELDDAEAQALTASLNQEFADIGQFHVASAKRWYMRLNVAVDHPVEPISSVAGRRVDGELTGNALPLTRWLNEVQMFLHGHPVNEKRESQGKPVINSLWLWGGGKLDEAQCAAGHSAIFSDNPLAIGIASAAGIPLHAKPANLAALLAQAEAGDNPLFVFDQLLSDILYENSEGWRDDFNALENDWFLPLKNALGKQVDRITLLAPTVYGELRYTINAGERWKFWKKGSSVQAIAQALAGNTSK